MNAQLIPNTQLRFIELDEVIAKVRLGKTAIYDRIKVDAFPKPVKQGRRKSVWVEHEIDNYMTELMETRYEPEYEDDEL